MHLISLPDNKSDVAQYQQLDKIVPVRSIITYYDQQAYRKQVTTILIIVILLLALPLILYLVRQQQIFRPKAVQPTTGSRIVFYDNTSGAELPTDASNSAVPVTGDSNVKLKIYYQP